MISRYLLTTIIAAAALAVAGCEGDDGARGAPGADGAGASQTLNERFSGGGTWAVTAVGTAGLSGAISAMTYDADADDWLFTVGADTFTLDALALGVYSETGCDTTIETCATFEPDGGSLADRFGTFARVTIDDGGGVIDAGYTHYGFGTVDMPATGSGDYTGTFQGDVDNNGASDTLSGITTIGVDFGTGEVIFDSAGNGAANAGAATYEIAGTASIAGGNDYSGSLSVATYDADGVVGGEIDYIDGLFDLVSGTFYGDVAQETAGVVSAADGLGNSLVGGFQASGEVVGGTVE